MHFYAASDAPPRYVAPILREIEDYLAGSPMSVTTFGTKAMGDPRFIYTLRQGRDPSSRTVERVRNFMRGEAAHA
ncbi:hypothetical protein BV97_03956 [Novosphingobium resinovorum]|uniref:Uncharacterized protein n=1 Tax=Novosphingobium resinovorum TaxID=158500 RepID=A0A031JRI6_9SPHN|nr:hypothetical protein [Novosphingobium resinovorum]EZP79519.1 hypothetical protein BV97_03956 [Novosphingobium resinovorum]